MEELYKHIKNGNYSKIYNLLDNNKYSLPEKDKINLNEFNDDYTPLFFALSIKSDYKIIKILIDFGSNINTPDAKGLSPLMIALNIKYDKNLIELLLESNSHISYINNEGDNALSYAVKCNNDIDVIDVLLSYNPNINNKNKIGLTPIKYALMYGNLDILKLLICNNAKLYDTLLYAIKINCDIKLINLLLENGTRIDKEELTKLFMNNIIDVDVYRLIKKYLYKDEEILKKRFKTIIANRKLQNFSENTQEGGGSEKKYKKKTSNKNVLNKKSIDKNVLNKKSIDKNVLDKPLRKNSFIHYFF
jgi:ankyrin repeat protein